MLQMIASYLKARRKTVEPRPPECFQFNFPNEIATPIKWVQINGEIPGIISAVLEFPGFHRCWNMPVICESVDNHQQVASYCIAMETESHPSVKSQDLCDSELTRQPALFHYPLNTTNLHCTGMVFQIPIIRCGQALLVENISRSLFLSKTKFMNS